MATNHGKFDAERPNPAISASAGWIVAFAILGIGALIGMTIGLIIPCFGQAIPAEPLARE